MKKIIVLFLVISGLSFSAVLAGGKSFLSSGNLIIQDTTNVEIKLDDDTGFYLEYYLTEEESADMALGIKYNSYTQKDVGTDVAYVLTLYGVGRWEWDIPGFKPFFQVKAGYPYALDGEYIETYDNADRTATVDMKNDVYLGFGVGIRFLFADASVNYELSQFKLSSTKWTEEKKVSTSNVNFNVGFKF